MVPYTPNDINPFIEKLLRKINAQFEHEFVPIMPEPYSKPENCFMNVDLKVSKDGGYAHYGWAIFQSEIICEAERHAVWETEDGDLIDVTPRSFGIDRIMFISDEDLVYTGQLIDNVRINITNNKLVDHFILLCETLEMFYTYGTRLNDDMLLLPEPALELSQQYENLKTLFQGYLSSGATIDSPCLCGELRKYKNCHGKEMTNNFKKDLDKVKRILKNRPLGS